MDISEIGEEIFENRKSQLSSIHDPDEQDPDGIVDSADQLMGRRESRE